MSLSSWSVKNRVAVNIFTLVVIFAGYYAAFTQLQRDLFPDVSTNFIQITTLDPETGAPEDIERTITVPIEEELGNVDYLEEIRSISQDNFSNIFIEVDPALDDVEPGRIRDGEGDEGEGDVEFLDDGRFGRGGKIGFGFVHRLAHVVEHGLDVI